MQSSFQPVVKRNMQLEIPLIECLVCSTARRLHYLVCWNSYQCFALWDLLDPLSAPCGCLEGICEVLCLAYDLAFAKLHDAYRVR